MVSTLKNYEVNEDGLRRDDYEKLRKFAKPHIHFFDVLVNYAHILLHNFRQQQTVVHQSQYALVEDFHRFFFVSYLNISDNAFDIGRSLVQLFLMRLEIFPEVGRIYQAIGKLQGEEPHLLGGVAAQGRGGGGG